MPSPVPSTTVRPPDATLHAALRLAFVFALVRLLLQFALTLWTTHLGYGYFRDEFYYVICGRRLAWGYVDHGPIVALQARLGELLFGDSIFGIRVLSAAAGAVMIFLTGLIAWALGGRRSAQALAMIALICSPQFIGTDGFLSMNSCEPMFWMGCVLALLMMQRGRSPAFWWTFFGISAGFGLLNKPSMVFFLVALGVAMLFQRRKLVFTGWFFLGVGLMVVIALPNLLWQIHNHWPTLEFLKSGREEGKNVALGPVAFVITQIIDQQPINIVIWLSGLVALLREKSIARGRWLGITYVVFFLIMFAMHGKDYYLAPIYPALFAAGGVVWESRFAASRAVERQRVFAFPIFTSLLIVTTLLVLPLASPVLQPDAWIRYTRTMHLSHPEDEKDDVGNDLPQFFADRFGWQQMTDQFVHAYEQLSPEDRAQVCISGSNYGEAGALDFLGPRLDPHFPAAISGHNNYWLWGPRGCSFDVVLRITGAKQSDLEQSWGSVQVVGRLDSPHIMSFEHRNIYLLKHPNEPVVWKDWKFYY